MIERFALNAVGIMAAMVAGHEVAEGNIFGALLFGLITIAVLLTAMFRPIKATMTVEDLRAFTKAVIEHPKTPKKAKDKLDFILGFLDGIIEGKDLGQIRGFTAKRSIDG